ncbi:O-antigen ligase family protein [Serratia sp. JSRIV001]|uniref:O-antigen ligase family protein n=1 Tax=unclassified Serratia (in: enterobacteria) TaxID=2647522 RepID=UPI001CBCA6FD|nr:MULTISPECIES: O-antigen ligase family protein [unclassified Serratia (in: enterobacteria)]UAN43965.1 O-antigen ligase family protein [Serratia sp. JSRIV001]UAN53523.1 O-antigen ligase family protein [Serratia sp. JSRIV002]UAN58144.1 O-antigen ligase family protein [Serratia sp. JSRIV004]
MSSTNLSAVSSFTPSRIQWFGLTAFLLGVSLPTSNALMNIALGMVVVCLLWQRDYRYVLPLLKQPLVWLPALMFALLALSLLTQYHDYGPKMVGKYQKLLYVLPLALFFLTDRQLLTRFINGFLLSNAVILVISLVSGIGHVTLGGLDPQNPTVFKLQITQNVFMAFAVLVWLSRAFAQSGLTRAGYGVLAALATANVLLMVQGRTGYVALLVGVGVWLLLTLPGRQRLGVLVCGLLVTLALVLIPNRATERLALGLQEVRHCVLAPAERAYQACDNSMGQRTAFAREAFRLIRQAPLLGNGAGSFWYGNAQTGYSVHNPHNEYLLETVQNGLLGLALFLGWMWCCLRAAWRQPVACRNLWVAILGSYMACHLFNSFLLDSAEGHLFMVIAANLASLTVVRREATVP